MKTEVFAHPLSFRTAPQKQAERLRAAGADRVRLAYAYHGGRWLLTTSDPAAVADFAPGRWFARDSERDNDDSLGASLPVLGDDATAAAAALAAAGIAVTGWLVGLHQSQLATNRPDLALFNAFGHPYRHALCPAQPEVVRYAAGLVAQTARQPQVDGLELEAFAYLGWHHQSAHDKFGVQLRPADRWLLSLCFCTACSTRLADAAETAGRARRAVLAQLAEPQPSGGIAQDAVAALGRDLHDAVLAMRANVTAELVTASAHASGGLPVSVRVTDDPYACNGKSAGDLYALAEAAGSLTVTNLEGDAAALRRDLVAASRTAVPVTAGWNLGAAATSDEEDLQDIAKDAHTYGAASLVLYAYDLAPAPRLKWLRDLPTNTESLGTASPERHPNAQTEPAT
ncbi:hypothetical protein [Streptomyces sp. NBC_00687]|uniref:hypothetical protein n=1 Tax=Streptomyces sp. NBC_00687 TaxID=2975807 RepID=UPI0022577BAC|nr:hypothetical protein [Streptomyces sp. NBC_00687]MCX4918906.1 hypothetical protein [Streptomyces sp. NBC_00687]